jgi:hypothetical protein
LIGNFIIPTDEVIFFGGVGIPLTRYHIVSKIIADTEYCSGKKNLSTPLHSKKSTAVDLSPM